MGFIVADLMKKYKQVYANIWIQEKTLLKDDVDNVISEYISLNKMFLDNIEKLIKILLKH